ncbi:hypothetical protein SARC_05062 [Sphaeroforma arctica JP610]|uniref:K Homology domain-containing protein n=1 Tax=Sphaeroforma arctica JP610 TaxID=667725 RepID=A0A0L0G0M9_9EUKA|nr:hypothetical protein SARC_05062 [Sphaeroforma arctica JP610]KNC82662.1 hypothetical protein SARC_05062 [Sphaeroforma arctica JP610]|eukprot:XP_014156564.1 hypothetical protein SARC_05062 [Sphaeroforma arctica JP610]
MAKTVHILRWNHEHPSLLQAVHAQSKKKKDKKKKKKIVVVEESETESEEEEVVIVKKKKSKKAAATTSAAPAQEAEPEKVEEPEKAPEMIPASSKKAKKAAAKIAKQAEEEAKAPEPEVSEEADEEPEKETDEPEAAPKKKKNKKKKKKAAVKEQTLPAGTVMGTTEHITKEAFEADDEWETVKSKQKKPKEKVIEEATIDESGSTATINCGNHVLAIIGPKGSVIQEIQSSTGAKIDLDRSSNDATITGEPDCVKAAVNRIEKIVGDAQKLVDSRQQVVIDLQDKMGAVIGKGGENIKSIQQDSGARLDIDKDTNTITIGGQPAEVEAARVAVMLIMEPPPPESTYRREIETRMISAVVGKKGVTIRHIQDTTNAKIDIERAAKSFCVISGDSTAVMQASEMISKVIAEHSCFHSMDISTDDVRLLIGEGGATIRQLQADTGAFLDIDRDHSGSGTEVIRISGTQDAVNAAKASIEKTLSEPPPLPKLSKGEVLEEIDVGTAVGNIIGSAGANIKKLQEQTGAKIDIPRGLTSCRIYGEKAKVAECVEKVKEIVEKSKELDAKKAEYEAKLAEQAASSNQTFTPDADVEASWGVGGNWGGSDPEGW